MDVITQYISNKVKEGNISLLYIAEKTGIPYRPLYDSLLHKRRKRELRGWEVFLICNFLNIDLNELNKKLIEAPSLPVDC